MAIEKTGEGIRKFAADVVKLEKFVASKLKEPRITRIRRIEKSDPEICYIRDIRG